MKAHLCLMLAAALVACAPSETSAPKTGTASEAAEAPATVQRERRALAFIEALNTGDFDAYEAYSQENRSARALAGSSTDDRRASFTDLREMFGALTVLESEWRGEAELAVHVRTEHDETLSLVFGFDEDGKVDIVRFEPDGPDIAIDPNWSSLEDLLTSYQEATGVPAWAAAVVRNGEIIDAAAVGFTDASNDAPVDLDESRFHWGSATKSVTGTVIGALIEDGQLDWDTTIADVLGEDAVLPGYREATIAQLMSHSAGVPAYDNFTEESVAAMTANLSGSPEEQRRQWALGILANEAPIFAPGTSFRYSNAGITIAGVMAEAVSGKSWEALVRERVFEPAGMESAGFGWPATVDDPDQTRGHFGRGPEDIEVVPLGMMDDVLGLTAPAGNVQSNVTDFARYALMHLNGLNGEGGHLDAATVQRLHKPAPPPPGAPEAYTFGWGVNETPDGRAMHWHNGSAGTFYAEVRLVPELGLGILIMANAGFAEMLTPPLWNAIYLRHSTEEN